MWIWIKTVTGDPLGLARKGHTWPLGRVSHCRAAYLNRTHRCRQYWPGIDIIYNISRISRSSHNLSLVPGVVLLQEPEHLISNVSSAPAADTQPWQCSYIVACWSPINPVDPTFSEGVNEFSLLKATRAFFLLKGPTITKQHLSPPDMPMGLHGLAKILDWLAMLKHSCIILVSL